MNGFGKILKNSFCSFFKFPDNFSDNLTIFKYVFLLFLGWRISLFLIAYFGLSVLPTLDFYNKELFFPPSAVEYWTRWANWDSGSYLYIAQYGYIPKLTVFFPLYPLLIKFLHLTGLSFFWSGFLISQIATLAALFYFYKLIILDFKTDVAQRSLFALLIFPASFYLGAVYNESIILATTLAAFYYARQKNWFLAALFTSLAVSTRLTGLAALCGIGVEYLFNDKKSFKLNFIWQTLIGRVTIYLLLIIFILGLLSSYLISKTILLYAGVLLTVEEITIWGFISTGCWLLLLQLKKIAKQLDLQKFKSGDFWLISFSVLPLILYLAYQYFAFGSAFSFINSEISWGRTLTPPWNGLLYALRFISSNLFNITEVSSHFHLRLMIFGLSLAGLSLSFVKLRLSYTIFYMVAFIIPLFSGTLADITRYNLIIFPLFIILGMIKNKLIQQIGLIFSIMLLSLLVILFINSYFFI